jgi:SpoVK/Ycf46/Vps4 family AAA+-type ATPase
MLNVESRFEVTRIVEALKARGHGTLCFYGAPGTGKTALAEHIARCLDRPLLIKQASDLMSKFVGETEQNMARMFDEAESEEAVLLLDEADSFLQDQAALQRTHEVTEVNESCRHGATMVSSSAPPTCSTGSTSACRFTFKIVHAADRRAARADVRHRGAGRRRDLTRSRSLPAKLPLCPGDFAAVKRQTDIPAVESPPAAEFLTH